LGGAAEAHLRTDLGLAATGGASKHAGPVTFILIVAAVLSLPCLVAGLPGDQDGLYHVSNQRSFTRNFWSGDLYPRWLAEVNAGAGSPIMYILYPAPYFAAALLSPLLPDSVGQPTASLAAGLVAGVAMIASGLAAWLWLRTLVMPWAAAFGAVSYMLLPYHFAVDLYSRAAVGEHAAFVWLPLLMMFAGRRVADKTCDIVGAGVGFALLVLCHLFTAILFLPVAAAYCALRSQGRLLQSLLRFSAALALGAALAGVYLVPLVAHQPSFDHRLLALDSSGNFDYRHHFACFTEGFLLYAGELAARLRIPASLLGLLPAVTAGLCAAAAAGSAVAAGRIRPVEAASFAAFVAGTLAILALPPAEPLWRAAGFLRPFEFAHSLFASKVFFTTAATAMLAAAAAAGALLRLRALALLLMATAAGATFMTLPWSLPVWEAIPSLANLDFPWRFNTLITFAAAILISLSLDSLLRIRTRAALTAALALCSAAILASVVNATLFNVQSRFLHPPRFADKQGMQPSAEALTTRGISDVRCGAGRAAGHAAFRSDVFGDSGRLHLTGRTGPAGCSRGKKAGPPIYRPASHSAFLNQGGPEDHRRISWPITRGGCHHRSRGPPSRRLSRGTSR
jgi:hypothetical protein